MKLDNRPRKLLVKGVPEESVEVAQNWYGVCIPNFSPVSIFFAESEGSQTTNGVESVERLTDGDLIVSFKTRSSAEQVRWMLLINPPDAALIKSPGRNRDMPREQICQRSDKSR